MDRVILHCDLNSFYASVELLDHPELRVVQQFHRGVKAVQITVQNHPVHTVRLLAAPL